MLLTVIKKVLTNYFEYIYKYLETEIIKYPLQTN